jgi:hypothetical protein
VIIDDNGKIKVSSEPFGHFKSSKNKKKVNIPILDASIIPNNDENLRSVSVASTIPDYMINTPTQEDPLDHLDKIDLTMSSHIKPYELREFLIKLISNSHYKTTNVEEKKIKKKFPNDASIFPTFGESPNFGNSPSCTPRTITPQLEMTIEENKEVLHDINCEVEEEKSMNNVKKKVKTQAEIDEEMAKKIRDRMPTYERSTQKIKREPKQTKIKTKKASKTATKSEETKVEQLDNSALLTKNLKKRSKVNKVKNIDEDSNQIERQLEIKNDNDDDELRSDDRYLEEINVESDENKINEIEPIFGKTTPIEIEENRHHHQQQQQQQPIAKKKERERKNSFYDSKTRSMSKRQQMISDQLDSSSNNTETLPVFKNESKPIRNITTVDLSDNQIKSNAKASIVASLGKKLSQRSNQERKNRQELYRAENLVEFINNHKVPLRLGSGKYELPFTDISASSTNIHQDDLNNKQIDETVCEEDRPSTEQTFTPLDNWLVNFNKKIRLVQQRSAQAKLKNDEIFNNSRSKWLKSIERKASLTVNRSALSSANSSFRLHHRPMSSSSSFSTKSGSDDVETLKKTKINEESFQSRPPPTSLSESELKKMTKAVSFVEILPKKADEKRKEEEDQDNNNTNRVNQLYKNQMAANLIVQPTYLVSQLEMEDILNEIELRNTKNKVDSSNIDDEEYNNLFEYDDNDSDDKSMASESSIDNLVIFSNKMRSSSMLSRQKTTKKRPQTTNVSLLKLKTNKLERLTKSAIPFSNNSNKTKDNDEIDHVIHRLSLKSFEKKSTDDLNTSTQQDNNKNELIRNSSSKSRPITSTTTSSSNRKLSRRSQLSCCSHIVERTRTPNSIPSKTGQYRLVKYPEISLEYQLPNCPERYLLPIRFPILYENIVNSLLRAASQSSSQVKIGGLISKVFPKHTYNFENKSKKREEFQTNITVVN